MATTEGLMTPGVTVYSPTARVLHWFTAVLVLIMIPAGFIMANIGAGPLQDFLFNLHRSFGVLLMPVILVRLAYRLGHPPPPLPPTVEPLQQLAAHVVHMALYTLLIVQPIVGWIGTSAFRAPIPVFGLFELPPIWPEDRAFSDQLFVVHRVIGILIALLLVAHIGAALFHHFIRRDQVLLRMWSTRGRT
jgi:cytochrome b561